MFLRVASEMPTQICETCVSRGFPAKRLMPAIFVFRLKLCRVATHFLNRWDKSAYNPSPRTHPRRNAFYEKAYVVFRVRIEHHNGRMGADSGDGERLGTGGSQQARVSRNAP